MTDIRKHSSLLQYGQNDCNKKFYSTGPRQLFPAYSNSCELVQSQLAFVFTQFLKKMCSKFDLMGMLQALPTNISLGRKGLPWTTILAHMVFSYVITKFYYIGTVFTTRHFLCNLRMCQISWSVT